MQDDLYARAGFNNVSSEAIERLLKKEIPMTPEQEKHLQNIKEGFSSLVDPKYRKGQKEHGGNLFDKNLTALLDMALEEAIDQFVYLYSIKLKLAEVLLDEDYTARKS